MKKMTMLTLAACVLLIAGTAAAQNTLYVDPVAAMNGTNYGMVTELDGSSNAIYVEDDTPLDETTYRAIFWFDPNSFTMAQGASRMAIFFVRDFDPTGGMPAGGMIRIELVKKNDKFRVLAKIKKNNGLWVKTNTPGTGWLVLGDEPRQIMLEYVAGPGDGLIRLTRMDGGGMVENTSINNSFWNVDNIRLGAPRLMTGVASFDGTMYFDEFESFRTLAP